MKTLPIAFNKRTVLVYFKFIFGNIDVNTQFSV